MIFEKSYWNSGKAVDFFHAENPERKIIQPKIAEHVLRYKPNHILDYGCGDGYLATILPKDIKIDLFDKNEIILKETFERLDSKNCFTLKNEKFIKENFYDVITLNFVLVCIDSKEEQKRILNLLYKSLKFGGVLIITNSHPCFLQYKYTAFHTSFKPTSYIYNDEGQPYVVNINQPENKPIQSFTDYKWKLSFWVNLAIDCKYILLELLEIADEDFKNLKGNDLYPPFLILKFKK